MTRTFQVNGNNDLSVTSGTLTVARDLDAVLLICQHAAKAILGEMVFQTNQGMPYFETVWDGNPTTAPFEAAFRLRIPQIEGVESIEELITEQVGGRMVYSATINTIYGRGQIGG